MSKKIINIAVLEPSRVIHEGLSNIFSKSGQYFKIFPVKDLNHIEKIFKNEKLDIVIINPSQIQNKDKEFISLKKASPDTCWAALVYTFFNQQMLALFDKIIDITDSPETIIGTINRLNDTNNSQMQSAGQEQLTEREIEVLKLLVTGLSNKEIADKLFISVHTVVSHRKNISQKTGIKSQSGLTIYAISNKIINLEDYSH